MRAISLCFVQKGLCFTYHQHSNVTVKINNSRFFIYMIQRIYQIFKRKKKVIIICETTVNK